MCYRNNSSNNDDYDYPFAYEKKVAEVRKRGYEVHEDRDSGCAFTSRSTILPDGTEVMDM